MNLINPAIPTLAAQSSSGTNYLPLLLIAGLFALTYFMIIRPQSKRRRAMVEMQSSLAAGTQVVTIGGLYGTVAGTDAETVELQIAPNVSATYARGAIARVISPTQELGNNQAIGADEADSDSARGDAASHDVQGATLEGGGASGTAAKENTDKTQTETTPKS